MTLNGTVRTAEVRPDTTLFDFLREQGCYSVKCGCETSNCGLCTVHLDGHPVLSWQCAGSPGRWSSPSIPWRDFRKRRLPSAPVWRTRAQSSAVSAAPADSVGAGNGRELQNPTDDEIRHYLAGNLCRCTGYQGQLRAIRRYLTERKEASRA